MKIYDMIEGKWLKEEKIKEKKERGCKELDPRLRLLTYEEEKDQLKREKEPSS